MIYLTINKTDIKDANNKTISFIAKDITFIDKKVKNYGGKGTEYFEYSFTVINLIKDGSDWSNVKCNFDAPKELHDILGKQPVEEAHIEVRQLKSAGKFINYWGMSKILSKGIDNSKNQSTIDIISKEEHHAADIHQEQRPLEEDTPREQRVKSNGETDSQLKNTEEQEEVEASAPILKIQAHEGKNSRGNTKNDRDRLMEMTNSIVTMETLTNVFDAIQNQHPGKTEKAICEDKLCQWIIKQRGADDEASNFISKLKWTSLSKQEIAQLKKIAQNTGASV